MAGRLLRTGGAPSASSGQAGGLRRKAEPRSREAHQPISPSKGTQPRLDQSTRREEPAEPAGAGFSATFQHRVHWSLSIPALPHLCLMVSNLRMRVETPEDVERRLTRKQAALQLAIGMFVSDDATLGRAAGTAGMTQLSFLQELGKRHISIHYGPQELEQDLETIAELPLG